MTNTVMVKEDQLELQEEPEHRFMGQLRTLPAIREYVEAGNATLTVRSKKTSERFTFKFVRPAAKEGCACPIFVRLLTGPDNESHYEYLGVIWPDKGGYRFVWSHKSRILLDAPSAKAATWFIARLSHLQTQLLEQAEVWHEGRCGRCGRKLTVPESIGSGYGPECISHILHRRQS